MTDEFRGMFMDSIMEDVHALLNAAWEAGDITAYDAIHCEWNEYLVAPDGETLEVYWCEQLFDCAS